LFFSPQIGMADSADFARIMTRLGLGRPFENAHLNFFNFFNSNYPITGKLKFPLNPAQIFGSVAFFLNKWLYSEKLFSIYILSAMYIILYIIGFHHFIRNLLGRVPNRPFRFLLLLISLLIFTDVMFISYFNSFYQESIFIISGLYVIALLLQNEVRHHLLLLAFFFLFLSKGQNLIFIVFPIFIIVRRWKSLNKYYLTSGILITAFVLFFQLKTQVQTNEANLYESVFLGLLYQADETEQKSILKQMGLNNPHYLDNVGKVYWRPGNELYDYNLNKEFYQKVKNGTILKMYFYHPDLFLKTGMAGLKMIYNESAQPDHLGNLSLQNSIDGQKTIVKSVYGKYLNKLIIPGYFVIFLFYICRSILFRLERAEWIAWALLIFIPLVFVANFVAGGINDFIKHNLSVYFMFSVLLVLFFLSFFKTFKVNYSLNNFKIK